VSQSGLRDFGSKKWALKKYTNKIHFKRIDRIQDDDVIPRGKYFGGKRRKINF